MTHPPYPYPHAPAPPPAPDRRRWWQHPGLIIPLLVVLPPIGIVLIWTSRWKAAPKVIVTFVAGAWMISPFLADPPPEKAQADAKPKAPVAASATPPSSPSPTPSGPPNLVGRNLKDAQAAAVAAGFKSISHDAGPGDTGQWADGNWKVCFQALADKPVGKQTTIDFAVTRNEWPCPGRDDDPIPYPKMPKVVGQTFVKASALLKPTGLQKIEAQSAYTDVPLPAAVDDWTVCFQEPEEGKEIQYPKTVTAYLKLTAHGTPCPKEQHAKLHPDPDPARPSTGDEDSGSTGGSSTSGGSSSSGGGGSAYYKNCDAAKAANAAPIRRGEPGYRNALDRDGDGIACDR